MDDLLTALQNDQTERIVNEMRPTILQFANVEFSNSCLNIYELLAEGGGLKFQCFRNRFREKNPISHMIIYQEKQC